MKVFLALGIWGLLLVSCWPLAVALLLLFPLLWVVLLPVRLATAVFFGLATVLLSVLTLPVRLISKALSGG